jgi:hypothetical protein
LWERKNLHECLFGTFAGFLKYFDDIAASDYASNFPFHFYDSTPPTPTLVRYMKNEDEDEKHRKLFPVRDDAAMVQRLRNAASFCGR